MKPERRLSWLWVLAVALCVGLLVHAFWLTVVSVPEGGLQPHFQAGDRVIINRWSYGLRTPFSRTFGYHRWAERSPSRGDWLAYNRPCSEPTQRPDTAQLFLGQVMSLPADTVWMGDSCYVSTKKSYNHRQIYPIVVPGKGHSLQVHPWNATLYARTLRQHEGVDAIVRNDSLFIKGKPVERVTFRSDYYWVTSSSHVNLADSRTLGFIPRSHLVGRVMCRLFSSSLLP